MLTCTFRDLTPSAGGFRGFGERSRKEFSNCILTGCQERGRGRETDGEDVPNQFSHNTLIDYTENAPRANERARKRQTDRQTDRQSERERDTQKVKINYYSLDLLLRTHQFKTLMRLNLAMCYMYVMVHQRKCFSHNHLVSSGLTS